jgi:hypothetical protein
MAAHTGAIPTRIPLRRLSVSAVAWGGIALLVLVGVVAAFTAGEPERMWLAIHFNWLFWSSLATGMVVFSMSLHITNARWSWPLRRFASAGVAFLPLSLLLFVLKLPGRPVWFEHWWGENFAGDHILQAKSAWLSGSGMLLRDLLALVVLFGMMGWFTYHMLRPDLHEVPGPGIYRRISGGTWRGVQEEAARSRRIAMRLAPITCLLFALLWGLIGIDQAMTMLPHWYSTMFPVTFLVSAFHSALACVAILMVLVRKQCKLEDYIGDQQFHDLGKLIFAYAVFWMYVNWSQYVVIWYGQLPHEQEFFVLRFKPAFALLTEIAVGCIFLFPFLALLPRAPKKVPGVLAGVAAVVVFGHWLERYLITVPSVWHGEHAPFGFTEIGIALGFAGLFLASVLGFLAVFPVLASPASLASIPSPTIQVPVRDTVVA